MSIVKYLMFIILLSSCNQGGKDNQKEIIQVISNQQSSVDRESSSSLTSENEDLIGKWASEKENTIYHFQKSGNVEEISDCSNSNKTATVRIRRVTKYRVLNNDEIIINPFPVAKSRLLKAHENQNKTDHDFVCEKSDNSKTKMKAVLNNSENLEILGKESLIKL